MPRHITEYVLYRWRYQLGYALVGLLVAGLLIVAAVYVPGGLSAAEMTATVESSQLSTSTFDPGSVINLPYKLLQHLSFILFGVTTLSIKLPSLLLGLLSLVGIILLLRHWFHMNVAIISALIVITTSQFIFSSQDGTPTVMYVFMPVWILLLAMKVSRQTSRRSLWELFLVAILALSLYTPLSLYVIVALGSATILHPHLRYIVGRLSRRRLLVAGIIGVLLILPLVAALVSTPEIALTLLGIPDSWPNILVTGSELFKAHFGFLLSGTDGGVQPVYTLPSLILVALGILHLIKTKYTARSYIIASWVLLLAPVVLINPSKTTITFVPVMLLIAAGIDELLHRWYAMFPRNPYARVAGLFPITLLVAGMALTGIERYFYAYRYSPPVASNFSDDLNLLDSELRSLKGQSVMLVATETEFDFYQAVATGRTDKVSVVNPKESLPEGSQLMVTRAAFAERDMGKKEPAKIVTNGSSEKSDRWYLYKTTEK